MERTTPDFYIPLLNLYKNRGERLFYGKQVRVRSTRDDREKGVDG